jgi:CBS domain containing-hemolysin-like protein
VDTVRSHESINAVLTRMATGHTRYPVVGGSTDDLLGVIDLHAALDADPAATAESRCRPAVQVPSSLSLQATLNQLGETGDEMALVIDEYGGFAGIVTVEDIAEELVGEIADEHDATDVQVIKRPDGWVLPGELHVDEAQRLIDQRLPDGNYETVAGLLMHNFGRLPDVGDTVEIALPLDSADLVTESPTQRKVLSVTVRSVDRRVPASVLVSVQSVEADGE